MLVRDGESAHCRADGVMFALGATYVGVCGAFEAGVFGSAEDLRADALAGVVGVLVAPSSALAGSKRRLASVGEVVADEVFDFAPAIRVGS